MYTCCVERINYEDFLDSEFTHTLNALLGSTNVIGPAVCWCGLLLGEEFPVSTSQGRVRRLVKTSSARSHQGEVVWNFQESGPLIGQAAQESGPLSSLHRSTGREDRPETSAGNWLVCGKQPGSMLSMELTKGAEPVEWLLSVQFDIWLCSRHTVDGSLPLGGVPGRQLVWPLIGWCGHLVPGFQRSHDGRTSV